MKNVKTEYLILAPMIPMVVHIYDFFAADHWVIAALIAGTFDLSLFLLFRYLRIKELRRDRAAYRVLWTAIVLATGFQLYVNIRVYWAEQPGTDAVVMGSIFPLMFAALSFISSRLERVSSVRQPAQPGGSARRAAPPKLENRAPAPAQNGQAKASGTETGALELEPNMDNRALAERVFAARGASTEAVKELVNHGVPKSSAYRYKKQYAKHGGLS